ncbi:glycoamidase [Coprinopsis cinerea okayama7|uniref:Glycoamidase n=1 Tax=Coprinopsis cinerea (strain Okayama-7 / 130 / ATCC MYA-4618 / FGSC 9003) TaxID=240176 RepID=A8NFJ8_COPC7|nr:glycoamidase [Coprinopsis cinerea okayama7\|eukprot:XP_001833303.2 glycoamidase [Coprinopsis cinerea okayama7\
MALLSSFAAGLPRPLPQDDSAIGIEVAVSAPDGIPITNTIELASQRAREAAQTAAAPAVTPMYGAASYGAEHQQPKHEAPVPQVEQPKHEPPKHEVPAHVTTPVHVPAHTPVEQPAHTPVHTPVEQPAHTPVHTPVEQPAHTPVHTPVEQPAHTPVHTPAHEPAHPIPTHGSGSAPWSNQDYNDCVSKCIATYGQAPGQYKPTVTEQQHEATGTGATHTVIVAPTQGVLRYIPFAVNASVGDTIKFMWGADNHTVTKSTSLLPCNRTGEAASFSSGIQNNGFVFTQVVNDTKPTYFFCNAPTHCQKGMFGIINPATQFASPSSVGLQMSKLAAKSANVAGYSDITRQATKDSDAISRWGSNIDMAEIPDWAHEFVAENVLYTRNFLAANPEVMKEDGSIDLSTASTVPLAIPQDVAAALNNAGSSEPASSDAPAEASTPAATSDAPEVTGNAENLNSGSSSTLASPKVLLAVVAVVATLLM